MMDLVEFLTARLDEDRRLALAAVEWSRADGRWHQAGTHPLDNCRVEGADIIIYDEGGHDQHQAAHIARHDPARVLSDVASKRAMLALGVCMACGVECQEDTCLVLDVHRLLAQPYTDHPDFDPAWLVP